MLSLVARRQIIPWKDWQPWLGLFGLALPLGALLSFNALVLDSASDLYLWILRNRTTIDPNILESIGLTLNRGILQFIAGALLLASWSWISGCALATLSRRATWVNGTVFCLSLAFAAFSQIVHRGPYRYSVSGSAFPLTFYTAILPLLLLATLVLLPAFRGTSQSHCLGNQKIRTSILWTGSIVLLAAPIQLLFWKPSALVMVGMLAGYWPVGYLITLSFFKRSISV
jgi:hypothetical protein